MWMSGCWLKVLRGVLKGWVGVLGISFVPVHGFHFRFLQLSMFLLPCFIARFFAMLHLSLAFRFISSHALLGSHCFSILVSVFCCA